MSSDDEESGPLVFTNNDQFEEIENGDTLLLFYVQDESDQVTFDPNGDAALLALMRDAVYSFKNTDSLLLYESLVTRARYRLRLHPDQDAAAQLAALSLTPDATAGMISFVYKRDHPGRSAVENRRQTPFMTLDDTAPPTVVLFREYSFQPAMIGQLVWYKQAERSATIGILGLEPQEVYK